MTVILNNAESTKELYEITLPKNEKISIQYSRRGKIEWVSSQQIMTKNFTLYKVIYGDEILRKGRGKNPIPVKKATLEKMGTNQNPLKLEDKFVNYE